jgi:hypothetical protein
MSLQNVWDLSILVPFSWEYTPIVHANAISLSQKWQRIQVSKKNSCSQWGAVACTQGAMFFFFPLGGRWGCLLSFVLKVFLLMKFSLCSHQVPNMFLKSPIAPHFIPHLFPPSSTLVTYITSPKDEITTYLHWDYPKFN